MDFNGSSGEEYGPTKVDEMIQNGFFDLSDLNKESEMIMSMSIQ